MKRIGTLFTAAILLVAMQATAQTFQVEQLHLLYNSKGKLLFSDERVQYIPDKQGDERTWKYEDIQQLALAPDHIDILSYNSQKLRLGADQVFQFKILSGTVTEQFRREISAKLSRPLVSSIVPEQIQTQFSIPVRHRLFMGGSQGLLEFGMEYIVYRSDKPKDSRVWRYDELLSIGSTGPFQLRIGALQKTGGEYGEEKNFVFDLKRQLKSDEYDFIWNKINKPKIDNHETHETTFNQ